METWILWLGSSVVEKTPSVRIFFRQRKTPKTSNYCLKNRVPTAFQVGENIVNYHGIESVKNSSTKQTKGNAHISRLRMFIAVTTRVGCFCANVLFPTCWFYLHPTCGQEKHPEKTLANRHLEQH